MTGRDGSWREGNIAFEAPRIAVLFFGLHGWEEPISGHFRDGLEASPKWDRACFGSRTNPIVAKSGWLLNSKNPGQSRQILWAFYLQPVYQAWPKTTRAEINSRVRGTFLLTPAVRARIKSSPNRACFKTPEIEVEINNFTRRFYFQPVRQAEPKTSLPRIDVWVVGFISGLPAGFLGLPCCLTFTNAQGTLAILAQSSR